nr:MAG TPA_asm: periplasmic nitrate reductase [Caudoviricetes sp.]
MCDHKYSVPPEAQPRKQFLLLAVFFIPILRRI